MRSFRLSSAIRHTILPVASAALLLTGAQAQTQSPGTGSGQAASSGTTASAAQGATHQDYRAVRASELIGLKVRNDQGENLGQVGDLIVDMNTGDVRYAILQFDPGVFSGERLFAVPTKELRMGPDRSQVIYRMSRDRLEQTAINRSDWNRSYLDNRDNMARIDRAYGIQQPSQGARAHRLSDLLGRDVQTRAGENVGEIEDVIVNMAAQKVHYAVLHFDIGWTTPDKRVLFPLSSFELAQNKDELVLDVDKSKVRAMKDFTKDNYANLNNPMWRVDVDRYLVTVVSADTRNGSSSTTMGASPSASQNTQQGAQSAQAPGSAGSEARDGQRSSASAQSAQPAQSKQSGQSGQSGQSSQMTQSSQSSVAMQKLEQSAQRLRESIQAMAQRQPGPERDRAIEQTHQALRETNASMVALIPQIHSTSSGGNAKAQSNAEYDKSVQRLSKAADSLRQSIQAMAKQPAGEARTRAIEQANKALWETQEAMIAAYQQPGRSDSQAMGAAGKQSGGQQKSQ